MYTLSTQMKYNANNVTTVYTPIVGIDVKKLIAFVNADLAQFVKFPKKSSEDCWMVDIMLSGTFKLLKSTEAIRFCTSWYPFSKYSFKFVSKLDASVTNVIDAHTKSPAIIIIAIMNIIIELVFRLSLVFLIINLMHGSNNNEIMNATKNGI